MTTDSETPKSATLTPEQALAELKTLDVEARIDAVAKDLRQGNPRYAGIPGHDLARALGIPSPGRPGAEWSFLRYATRKTVEEHADYLGSASEVIYLLENSVEPERFQELLKLAELQDEVAQPDFSFLSRRERNHVEDTVAEKQLEANESNAMYCIAHYSVTSSSGKRLEFEAEIEDDGYCITLLTPYDKKAKRFVDLSKCVTTYW